MYLNFYLVSVHKCDYIFKLTALERMHTLNNFKRRFVIYGFADKLDRGELSLQYVNAFNVD